MSTGILSKARTRVVKKVVFLLVFTFVILAYTATPVLACNGKGDTGAAAAAIKAAEGGSGAKPGKLVDVAKAAAAKAKARSGAKPGKLVDVAKAAAAKAKAKAEKKSSIKQKH